MNDEEPHTYMVRISRLRSILIRYFHGWSWLEPLSGEAPCATCGRSDSEGNHGPWKPPMETMGYA